MEPNKSIEMQVSDRLSAPPTAGDLQTTTTPEEVMAGYVYACNVSIGDIEKVCLTDARGNVLIPREWALSEVGQKSFAAANELLNSSAPALLEYPWIISSTTHDLFGNERTKSEDHLKGTAFDLAPMFSDMEALSGDRRLAGLAWNLIKLAFLASLSRSYSWVVEGDHIHVSLVGDVHVFEAHEVVAVMSFSSWYAVSEKLIDSGMLARVYGAPTVFDIRTWSLEGPSKNLATKVKRYLKGLPNARPIL